jgi:hypothetical protein
VKFFASKHFLQQYHFHNFLSVVLLKGNKNMCVNSDWLMNYVLCEMRCNPYTLFLLSTFFFWIRRSVSLLSLTLYPRSFFVTLKISINTAGVFGLQVLLSLILIRGNVYTQCLCVIYFSQNSVPKIYFICRSVCKTVVLAKISVVAIVLLSLAWGKLDWWQSRNYREMEYVATCIQKSSGVLAKPYRQLVLA